VRFGNAVRLRIKGPLCVYCGGTANTDEHFPPASLTPNGYLLPACRECNSIAGTTWATDFEERTRHVKAKLRLKYRSHLETPEWSTEEKDELGYNLRKVVELWQTQKTVLNERLAWNAVAYLLSIDHNSVFAETFVEDVFLEKVKKLSLNRQKE